MNEHAAALITIAGVYFLGAASPGPNFFMVLHHALAGSRRAAVAAALGIATGSAIWVCAAMAGLTALLTQVPGLQSALRYGGALYIIWFGSKLLWTARKPAASEPLDEGALEDNHAASFTAWRQGLLTCLSNPKSGLFWTGVFAGIFPAAAPFWFYVVTACMIAVFATSWYGGVALVATMPQMRGRYADARRILDFGCGLLLVAIGLRIAITG